MSRFKKKKDALLESCAYLLQQIFIKTRGSWGPFIIDERGNFIEEPFEGKEEKCEQ
mgnify:CR=1 FL=1